MTDLFRQLHDYRLTTAEILYHLPDHPSLLQTFIWQELDIAPRFPVLGKFLTFWEKNIDGKLYRVRVASCEFIHPAEFKFSNGEFSIH
ncbi:MAG: usg protein [Dongiaceae bacterium]